MNLFSFLPVSLRSQLTSVSFEPGLRPNKKAKLPKVEARFVRRYPASDTEDTLEFTIRYMSPQVNRLSYLKVNIPRHVRKCIFWCERSELLHFDDPSKFVIAWVDSDIEHTRACEEASVLASTPSRARRSYV